MSKAFDIWATSCAHVGTDLKRGRKSLADAITQSEFGGEEGGSAFDWDIMVDCGDLSGTQKGLTDEEGIELVSQYSVMKMHQREQVYNVVGNHDATMPDEPTQWWFRKYADPIGENTEHSKVSADRRPFPVEGTWERYTFQAGNVLFLMLADRNDGGPPVGRSPSGGGYPAGAVTGETFDWWVDQVEANKDKIIVTMHHHMLKETTVGSGEWEGFSEPDRYGKRSGRYHGYFKDGGPMGASYLYWVDGNPDAQAFERYLAEHPGAIDLWIGGHTHTHPDDVLTGRSHIERKWDVNFLNCASLTRYHGKRSMPMSRVLTLCEGSTEARIRCYMHTSEHAPQGWHEKAERTIPLRHPFQYPKSYAAWCEEARNTLACAT